MPKNVDLPIDVMQMILEKCEYPVVQTVRKANSFLRDLVAKISPKSTTTSISIKSCKDSIQLSLTSGDPDLKGSKALYPKGTKLNIQYQSDKKGCWVVLEKKWDKKFQKFLRGDMYKNIFWHPKKLLKGENFTKIFWQDFKILMDYHKDAPLENFELNFEMVDITLDNNSRLEALKDHFSRFVADLGDFLVSRPGSSLKVQNFTMRTLNEHSLHFMLDLLDSNYLKGIKVSSVFSSPKPKWFWSTGLNSFPQQLWRNEEFRYSEQWQTAKRVEIDDFKMFDIEDVLHFEIVKGRWLWFQMNYLDRFVNSIFTTTTNPRNKHYHFIGIPIFIDTIEIRYGDSHDNKWYFSTPGSDTVVELFMLPKSLQLRGMKMEDVEQGREIQVWVDEEDEDVFDN